MRFTQGNFPVVGRWPHLGKQAASCVVPPQRRKGVNAECPNAHLNSSGYAVSHGDEKICLVKRQ